MLLGLQECHRFSVRIPQYATIDDLQETAGLHVGEPDLAKEYAKARERLPHKVGERWLSCSQLKQSASTSDLEEAVRRLRCRFASYYDQLAFTSEAYARWRAILHRLGTRPGSVLCLERVLERQSTWVYPTVVPDGNKQKLLFLRDTGSCLWPAGINVLLVHCE